MLNYGQNLIFQACLCDSGLSPRVESGDNSNPALGCTDGNLSLMYLHIEQPAQCLLERVTLHRACSMKLSNPSLGCTDGNLLLLMYLYIKQLARLVPETGTLHHVCSMKPSNPGLGCTDGNFLQCICI